MRIHGSNKTDDYSVAARLGEENILLEVKDDEFYHLFKEEKSADFAPMFVEANQKVVKLPKIENSEELKKHIIWNFGRAMMKSVSAVAPAVQYAVPAVVLIR